MEFTGEIKSIQRDWQTGQMQITFSINEQGALAEINDLENCKLSVKAQKFRKARSRDANALLWACIGELAEKLKADKWDIYLMMLKRYGQYTYICVKPKAVEAVKASWREAEVIGEVDINGQKSVQMLCYFGSHTYNSEEFSRLLDGVISEMVEANIQPPTSEEMKRSIEQWSKSHNPS